MGKMSVLHVEELTVNYDKTSVLWNVSFDLQGGQLAGIIGPNGAGKSTLLKSLLGLVQPLSGSITFFGMPLKKVRERIAYVPQRASIDWDFPMTAFDLVIMGRYGRLGYFKWPRQADKEATMQALEMVGMAAHASKQIGQLSGGQQQRLLIARALLQEADLYLMDEPFAGVDMATEKALIALMDQFKAKGKTLLIVHHDLGTVAEYFDWVIMLNISLVASGPVDDVFHQEMIAKTYGRGTYVLDEAAKLARHRTYGLK
jgi:manganese/zinc/iron transport system ATP- binding protein